MTVANSAGSERDAVLRIFTSIILPYPHNKAMKPVVLLFPFLHEKKKISERKMTFPGSFSGRTKIASLTLARAPLTQSGYEDPHFVGRSHLCVLQVHLSQKRDARDFIL